MDEAFGGGSYLASPRKRDRVSSSGMLLGEGSQGVRSPFIQSYVAWRRSGVPSRKNRVARAWSVSRGTRLLCVDLQSGTRYDGRLVELERVGRVSWPGGCQRRDGGRFWPSYYWILLLALRMGKSESWQSSGRFIP